jgi:hypothetical protein
MAERFVSEQGFWDGDEWGNEWKLGWTVHPSQDECEGFEVYEDDGKGNGDFVAHFVTQEAAEEFCRTLARAETHKALRDLVKVKQASELDAQAALDELASALEEVLRQFAAPADCTTAAREAARDIAVCALKRARGRG